MKSNILHVARYASCAAVILALVAAGVPGVRAQEYRGQLSAKDYKFICSAAEGGAAEVTLGQLALEKAQATTVKDFGKKMVEDHQKANDSLKLLAAKKGATVVETPSKKDEKLLDHLKGLSGAEFDRAYVKAMVEDHKADVKEFQQEIAKADDAEVKDWAAKTLPVLQEHLQLIQTLDTTVAASQ